MKPFSAVLLVLAAASFALTGCTGERNPLQSISESTPALAKPAKSATRSTWRVPGDFPTIQAAIDAPNVLDGHNIRVGPGVFDGAVVTKAVAIKGEGKTIINGGPVLANLRCGTDPYPLKIGFFFTGGGAGSGASISHLRFKGIAFPVFSRGADDVTVSHNTMLNPVQGISNWSGSSWTISHNTIAGLFTANGGGIGILIADGSGGTFGDNVVSHNRINGSLTSYPCEGGGYDGTGIVLYADWRYGRSGTNSMSGNRIVSNRVSLVSESLLVGVSAFELSQVGYAGPSTEPLAIAENAIGFNDFRRTESQIVITPAELADVNDISRNLGDNRGHGLHPRLFGPGGN